MVISARHQEIIDDIFCNYHYESWQRISGQRIDRIPPSLRKNLWEFEEMYNLSQLDYQSQEREQELFDRLCDIHAKLKTQFTNIKEYENHD